eukprot:jgi/Psemu1/179274/e_gw1.8.65.1
MQRPFRPSLCTVESIGSTGTSDFSSTRAQGITLPTTATSSQDKKPTISTITAFIKLTEADFEEQSDYALSSFPILANKIDTVVEKLKELEEKYCEKGYSVSSLRIATNPFGSWLLLNDEFVLADRLEFLDCLLQRHGIFGLCLGPARNLRELACVRQIIAASDKFHCFFVLDANDFSGASKVTEVIYAISSIDSLGLANTRFCVSPKTCGPWNPFFPVAYYDEGTEEREVNKKTTRKNEPRGGRKCNHHALVVRFAIGLNNGHLAHHLLRRSGSIENIDTVFRQGMIEALVPIQQIADSFCSVGEQKEENGAKNVTKIIELDNAFYDTMIHVLFPPGIHHDCFRSSLDDVTRSTKAPTRMRFMGIDTTIHAPLKTSSLVQTLESLQDIDKFGDCESIAACTAIRNILENLDGIRSTGFCGISLPLCSDERFIQLIESSTSPRDLLTITCACGNGVDLIPIPGIDVHFHEKSMRKVQSFLLFLIGMAEESARPVMCRMLPVPGKKKGDYVNFKSSPHLLNCKVVDLDTEDG